MAKLLKLRRGSTSQHSSFTGAEGEVTIDTTKDTAVVHDGAQAGGRPLAREDMSNVSSASIAGQLGTDSIATTKIAGGALPTDVTVTNANVVSNAAIAGTKISPSFGSQNIATSGHVDLEDSSIVKLGTDDDFQLSYDNGNNQALISMASGKRLKLKCDSIHINNAADSSNILLGDISGSVSLFHGTSKKFETQSGGINVTGNISVSGTVDGRDVASDGSKLDGIESGATADQTAAEIRTLVESASDSNVFTDADHSKLNGIESGATADQTAAEILTAIKTVDGAGSGLDADYLDGFTSSHYLNATNLSSGTVPSARLSASGILTLVKTVDGSGTGLDADLLDGLHGSSYLRTDTADTADGDITFNGGAGAITVAANSDIRFTAGTWTGEHAGKIQYHSNNFYFQANSQNIFRNASGTNTFIVDGSGNATATGNVTAYSDARLKTDISTINDALGICGKLRGVSYKWLKNGSAGIGVIAQEVEEVLPEVVLTTQDVNPVTQEIQEIKSVDYGKIVGVLINAINELKAEVDELKGGK